MLATLLSIGLLAVGDDADCSRSTRSARALEVPVMTLVPGRSVALDGGGDAPEVPIDSTPGEMAALALAVRQTPWVLFLVAGEEVHVPDVRALGGSLGAATGPLAPSLRLGGALVPDPLALGGARLLPGTTPPPSTWALSTDWCEASGIAPVVVHGSRGPFPGGSVAATWAFATVGRRRLDRATRPPTLAEALLDAALLTWGGETDTVLATLDHLTEEAAGEAAALAGRIRLAAALPDRRNTAARAGVDAWRTAAPDDTAAALWDFLLGAEDRPATAAPVPATGTPTAADAPPPPDRWYLRGLRAPQDLLQRGAATEVDFLLAIAQTWASLDEPASEQAKVALCRTIVSGWKVAGRDAAGLVDAWPVGFQATLADVLGDTPDLPPQYWLDVARACTAHTPVTTAILEQINGMLSVVPMSDALTFSLRAKSAGVAHLSPLRKRAAAAFFRPPDRVLAGAVALQFAGDAEAAALIRAAAAQCVPEDFVELVRDLDEVAGVAVPVFIEGAATTEARARAIMSAIDEVGWSPG